MVSSLIGPENALVQLRQRVLGCSPEVRDRLAVIFGWWGIVSIRFDEGAFDMRC